MIIEHKNLHVTDFVAYHEQNKGWTPALVTGINLPRGEEKYPTLNLVIFWTGMHDPSFSRENVPHGSKDGHWLSYPAAKQFEEEKAAEFERLKNGTPLVEPPPVEVVAPPEEVPPIVEPAPAQEPTPEPPMETAPEAVPAKKSK